MLISQGLIRALNTTRSGLSDRDCRTSHSALISVRPVSFRRRLARWRRIRSADVSSKERNISTQIGPHNHSSSQALQRHVSEWTAKPATSGPRDCGMSIMELTTLQEKKTRTGPNVAPPPQKQAHTASAPRRRNHHNSLRPWRVPANQRNQEVRAAPAGLRSYRPEPLERRG